MVTSERPLYFNVTSDFISVNTVPIFIVLVNITLYELLVWILKKWKGVAWKPVKTLNYLRAEIYWGLIISNVVPIVLPWKFYLYGGVATYFSKLNLCLLYLVLCVLLVLLTWSFLLFYVKVKRGTKEFPLMKVMRHWWDGYENYIYPIFILLDNPLIFLAVIALSNVFAFYNSCLVKKWKAIAIIKSCYPLIFHGCFLVFFIS